MRGGFAAMELLEDTPSGLSDWLALNRQKTKVHEHEFKPHGDLWICWCGEALERPKCEGCDD